MVRRLIWIVWLFAVMDLAFVVAKVAHAQLVLLGGQIGSPPSSTPVATPTTTATPSPTPSPSPTPILSYYIDSVGGSDAAAGTSPATAWQTLTNVNSKLSVGVAAGTSFFFYGGHTWTGSSAAPMVNLTAHVENGSAGAPITFASYNNSTPPIFDGAGVATTCFDGNRTGTTSQFSYLVITGFECKNTTKMGIRLGNGDGHETVGMTNIWITYNNIHNSGPGAYAGATQGPTSSSNNNCTNTPVTPGQCDDGGFNNQLTVLDSNHLSTGIHIDYNTVDVCGGHNCLTLQGATNGDITGNTVFVWVHNGIDTKQLPLTGGAPGVVVAHNVVHDRSPLFTAAATNGYYYEEDATTADTGSPPTGGVLWQSNVAYNITGTAAANFQCNVGSVSGGSFVPGNAVCELYNNTTYDTTVGIIGSGTGTSTVSIDARNNIWDTPSPCGLCTNVTTWDYNADGGVNTLSGTVSVAGAHDIKNKDPLYYNIGYPDFDLKLGSPDLGAGLAGLTPGNTNIGNYPGTGL